MCCVPFRICCLTSLVGSEYKTLVQVVGRQFECFVSAFVQYHCLLAMQSCSTVSLQLKRKKAGWRQHDPLHGLVCRCKHNAGPRLPLDFHYTHPRLFGDCCTLNFFSFRIATSFNEFCRFSNIRDPISRRMQPVIKFCQKLE